MSCDIVVDDDKVSFDEATLPLNSINTQIGFLMGKVLTIIDASISEKQQNKAMKDLIKNEFYSKLDWIRQISTKDFSPISCNINEDKIEEVSDKEVEEIVIGNN